MAFFFMFMRFFLFACVNYICSVFQSGTDGVGGFFHWNLYGRCFTATPHQPTSRCNGGLSRGGSALAFVQGKHLNVNGVAPRQPSGIHCGGFLESGLTCPMALSVQGFCLQYVLFIIVYLFYEILSMQFLYIPSWYGHSPLFGIFSIHISRRFLTRQVGPLLWTYYFFQTGTSTKAPFSILWGWLATEPFHVLTIFKGSFFDGGNVARQIYVGKRMAILKRIGTYFGHFSVRCYCCYGGSAECLFAYMV